jgi:hypothetical protein
VLLVDNPQELYDDFAEISMQKLPSYPRMFTAYPTAIDPPRLLKVKVQQWDGSMCRTN